MVYSISLCTTKISILLLVLRIFLSVQRDVWWWLTQSLIVLNTIFYIIFFLVPIFLCSPRSKIWNPTEPGRCLNIDDLYIASATFNMVSDISMLSVPIYLIWNLQMSVRRKIGVSLIFGTGGLSVLPPHPPLFLPLFPLPSHLASRLTNEPHIRACISSMIRLYECVVLTRTDDYTYRKMRSVMWTFVFPLFHTLSPTAKSPFTAWPN